MNYKRKKKRELLPYFGDDIGKIEELYWMEEQEDMPETDALYQCIGHLDAINKAIILLYLDGKSHEEISTITGFSKSNVGTRIGRIKEQIKSLIVKK